MLAEERAHVVRHVHADLVSECAVRLDELKVLYDSEDPRNFASRREYLLDQWDKRMEGFLREECRQPSDPSDDYHILGEFYEDLGRYVTDLILVLRVQVRRAATRPDSSVHNSLCELDHHEKGLVIGAINTVLMLIEEIEGIISRARFDPFAMLSYRSDSLKELPTPRELERALSKAGGTPF